MGELKYAKNIITETKPFPKEMLEKMQAMQKTIRSTIKGTRLLYLDDDVVKGAFYMDVAWMYEGTSNGSIEEPHVHDFDEILGFIGSDPKNPRALGGEIELWLEDERHILKNSCLVFAPKGLRHCPIVFRKVERPLIWFTVGPASVYKRESETLALTDNVTSTSSAFPPPSAESDAGSKYAQYIVTEMKPNLSFPKPPKDIPANASKPTRFLYLDDDVVKGAFYMECVWFSEGIGSGSPEPHIHDFDEVLGFMGSDPKNPRDLGGEVELWLDDEKYTLRNSCLVFVPKGLKHCPLIFKKVYKPIFHFSTGNGNIYKKYLPHEHSLSRSIRSLCQAGRSLGHTDLTSLKH